MLNVEYKFVLFKKQKKLGIVYLIFFLYFYMYLLIPLN